MPLLEAPAPPTTSFAWEEIGGDPTLRVERHSAFDPATAAATPGWPGGPGGRGSGRREPRGPPLYRVRLREFPKSVLAAAHTEDEIRADWARLQEALLGTPNPDAADVREVLATSASASSSPGAAHPTPGPDPALSAVVADGAPHYEDRAAKDRLCPNSGGAFPAGNIGASPGSSPASDRRDSWPAARPAPPPYAPPPTPICPGTAADGMDTPEERESVLARCQSAPVPGLHRGRKAIPRPRSEAARNMQLLGAYLCSLRTTFFGMCRALRANDPISVSLIAFLFLLLYSLGHLSTLFWVCIPAWQAYVLAHAGDYAPRPNECIAMTSAWVGWFGRWFERRAQRPYFVMATELGLWQYTFASIYTRPFSLLLALWWLLLFLYLFPEEWMEPAPPPPPGSGLHSLAVLSDEDLQPEEEPVPSPPPAVGTPMGPLVVPEPTPPVVDEAVPPGYLGHLTAEQSRTLTWLQRRILERVPRYAESFNVPPVEVPRHALKWLRMARWDREAALLACLKAADWRATLGGRGVQGLAATKCDRGLGKNCVTYTGLGHLAMPVLWVDGHLHRSRHHDPSEVVMAAVYQLEHALSQLTYTLPGPEGETVTVVLNLSQFGVANVDVQTARHFIDVFSSNYPETLHQCVVLDAPWLFTLVWENAKAWLPPATVAKVCFVRGDDLVRWVPRPAWHPLYRPAR